MGKGSTSPKQRVTEYNMSIHFGICHGPVDYLSRIRVNEKDAWLGAETTQTTIPINKEDLFGGVKKEGGVAGEVHYQTGTFTQKISAKLAEKLGLTPDNAPGYRGIATAFFTDSSATNLPGFYWSANQPYIPPVDFLVTRLTKSWYPETALIPSIPKDPVAVSFTIDDSGSMQDGNRLSTMKTAMVFALERIRGAIESIGLKIDLHIGKWGDSLDERTYMGVSLSDIDDAINFINSFSGSSGRTNFDWAAQGALGFFNQTINVDSSTANPRITLENVSSVKSLSGSTIYIGSQSATTGPIPNVLDGDELTVYLANGIEHTFTIQYTVKSQDSATWYLNESIDSFPLQTVEVTNPEDPGNEVSNASDLGTRAWVFITDGEPTQESDDVAAATASDLLDKSSGNFKGEETGVDAYGINISEPNTTATAKLDNTPQDGVPIIEEDEPTKLLNVIQQAIFGGIPPDLNPAHIVHECLTDSSWGMGAPFSQIEDQSFRDAADTLFKEGFGLSLIWVRQKEIESFIQEVLDHIEATLYVDPTTGKFNLKLIRDDYNPDTLPILDESVSTVTSFSRRSPAEIINEISVTWTNPENEKEEVLTIQDLGGIVQSGGQVIPDSRNYYGIRREDLAWSVAQRDISVATARLSTAEVEANRVAWKMVPGAVFKLRSQEHDVSDEIMRIVKISYGSPGKSDIKINATQDIFGFARPQYSIQESEDEEDRQKEPTRFEYVVPITFPYFMLGYFLDPQALSDADYPDAWYGVLAATENEDALEYELISPETDINGNVEVVSAGTRSVVSKAELRVDFSAEPRTEAVAGSATMVSDFVNMTTGSGPTLPGFGLIGSPGMPEHLMEIVMFSKLDNGIWTIERGLLDTIPREWFAGQSIYFFGATDWIADEDVRSVGEGVDFKTLMRTALGTFSETTATTRTHNLVDRPILPLRPSSVTVQGDPRVGLMDLTGATQVDLTWANRNRLEEDSQVLSWDDPGITPEAGQTTKITLTNSLTGDIIQEITGLSGESHSIPVADFNGASFATVKVTSERDGFESFTGYERDLKLAFLDRYGYNYGGGYGEGASGGAGFGNDYGNSYGQG